MIIRVRNWERFQHYRDRNPPWIKLHVALLDDYGFSRLSHKLQIAVVRFWMMAAKCGNAIDYELHWIQGRIDVTDEDITELVERGWLEVSDDAAPEASPWASRYVTKADREAVWLRDGHACRECGRKSDLEVDHIVPISRGGSSTLENLQLLCRGCNRSKHTKMPAAEQDAPQTDVVAVERAAPQAVSQPELGTALVPYGSQDVRDKTARRQTKEQALDLAAALIFAYWRDRMGFDPTRTILNDKRKSRIIARLRENGADVSELLYVVDGALKDPWTMGRDPRSVKAYNGTETIFRDREKCESYLALVKGRQDRHPFLNGNGGADVAER